MLGVYKRQALDSHVGRESMQAENEL